MPPEKRTSCRHTTHPAGRAQVFSLTSLFPAPPGQAPERDKLRRFAGRSLRLSARHSIPPFGNCVRRARVFADEPRRAGRRTILVFSHEPFRDGGQAFAAVLRVPGGTTPQSRLWRASSPSIRSEAPSFIVARAAKPLVFGAKHQTQNVCAAKPHKHLA